MVNTRLVNLNNKSRKGLYVYVKQKGVRGSYYKFGRGEKIDRYVELYRKKFSKRGIDPKKYIRELRKRGTISSKLGRGITSTTIPNVLKVTSKGVETSKKKLLSSLVKDKGLLDLIVKTENIKKVAFRLEYRIQLIDDKGKKINAVKFNDIPERVVNELKRAFRIDQEVEYPRDLLTMMGFKTESKDRSFKLKAIKMQIIFRKA